jgi:hypothetical protein
MYYFLYANKMHEKYAGNGSTKVLPPEEMTQE